MKLASTFIATLLITGAAFLSSGTPVSAQTLEAEGVVGDLDRQSRNPHLTISVTAGKDQVTILADAFHPSHEFTKYPIQFEFFINRTLFSTQYRSVKLPGPVGVTVPESVAAVPFNYVVVAKVIHPNSVYTTVIEGAATSDSSGEQPTDGTLACSLTVVDEDTTTTYAAGNVSISQDSDSTYNSDFTASTEDGDNSAKVSSTVNVNADDASSGTVTIERDGEDDLTFSGDASIETDGETVSKVTISSSENDSILSCSAE